METLSTVKTVIKALGGNETVAKLFGRTGPAASNWSIDGKFPPYTYFVLQAELAKIDKSAPRSLWNFANENEAAQ